ncbi:hypothetical protein E2C01_016593 [Portunus trituberculatus]|uniref:Uncharacterized protein n=1 Tax=Portunus trituberculatus TaxID=210409 RepID=A0A5B7DR40_PORTR|nr:hypothetical protein [Portunus trituberculatus]
MDTPSLLLVYRFGRASQAAKSIGELLEMGTLRYAKWQEGDGRLAKGSKNKKCPLDFQFP